MNIVVCIKQIQDPEIPPAKFRIDPVAMRVLPPEGISPLINPFDERAIEAALLIKDKTGARVAVITVGDDSSQDALKQALRMGADEAILVEDRAFEGSDSQSIALVLSRAIQKIGAVDLVLCGRQAADWDEAQVGSALAEALDMPPITIARKIEVADGRVKVECVRSDGHEVLEAALPALVTVSNEIGQPRLPTGLAILQAARKKVVRWNAADIGVSLSEVAAGAAHTSIASLSIPVRTTECEFIHAATVAEASALMAVKLREAKVI